MRTIGVAGNEEVLLLLGLGLAVGIPAALALGRFISAQLYSVNATIPGSPASR
jgi:hypothetical protein